MSIPTAAHRDTSHEERALSRFVVESFWTAVALGLGLLMFFLVAGGPSIVTWPVALVALSLFVLWGVHARSVRRHVDDVHHDERWRHARERRGF